MKENRPFSRIDLESAEKVKKIAEAEDRTFTYVINSLVKEALAAREAKEAKNE
ncbi:hypothetical protein Q7267_08030 [Glaesserella parasuis]|uniref:hypothetical protein n=1 Tax=Glaesserella parasuis TaxID=738 RepID=UPI0013664804|nr:hypothetical protein [Glaesserella parasuis]MDE4031144.1 hypothetical protein [Glaesserella parasuis]MDG6240812.1 hypothetical protein [Glaesserella parasuis]MDG6322057.1 hypothetical protein [Glaesserella parasuis]MDG6828702.1 hypothetical protein [Glaesserella parasuis]MDO9817632.1 hypothetical protein [Glaesserella parasuis]